jgi:hypothetical protein
MPIATPGGPLKVKTSSYVAVAYASASSLGEARDPEGQGDSGLSANAMAPTEPWLALAVIVIAEP